MHPITRKYRVDHLYPHTAILAGKLYVDWILARTKCLAHNAVDFVFSDGIFTEVYPSESKQKMPANMYLNDYCNVVSITEKLKSDKDPEFCGRNSESLKYAKRKGIDLT